MKTRTRKRKIAHAVTKIVAAEKESRGSSSNSVYDREDLLIEMLIGSTPSAANGTDIENLIYSSTVGTAELGYEFGFSVGRSMALKLGQDSGIVAVLDRIGLKDSIYNPFMDEVLITSRSQHPGQTYAKRCIHIYETGIISGYLSASTGIRINASEKRCSYNGSSTCQFSASHAARPVLGSTGIQETIEGIANLLHGRRFEKPKGDYYRVLACIPLLDAAMSEQVTKVLFMAGERLGMLSSGERPGEYIKNISNYFGAGSLEMATTGRKSIIRLRYDNYNSIRSFVAMPAAIIAGFYSARGYDIHVNFAASRGGNYLTAIEAIKRI